MKTTEKAEMGDIGADRRERHRSNTLEQKDVRDTGADRREKHRHRVDKSEAVKQKYLNKYKNR